MVGGEDRQQPSEAIGDKDASSDELVSAQNLARSLVEHLVERSPEQRRQYQRHDEQSQAGQPAMRQSRSAPLLRRRTSSRVQSFVAGLVADVEEYVGRGGYEVSPDDRADSAGSCGVGCFDVWEEEDGGGGETPRLGHISGDWWGFGGWGARGDSIDARLGGFGWMQANEAGAEEEGEGEEEGLNTALLSNVLKSQDDGQHLPSDHPPQDVLLRRARSSSAAQYGGNSVTRTVVTYMKGMVGSYVLYLPRMFAQGGMLFSAAAIFVLAVASTYNMLLLLRCRESLVRRGVSAYSYGEVARSALGRAGWVGVDVSLFLSQLGYCVVYLIFVDQNLGPILRRAFPSQPSWLTGTGMLLLVQACIQIPLSWVRRLRYLGAGMLVANVCVFGGLLIILFEVAQKLAVDGLAGEHTGGRFVLLNPGQCLILLGSVVGCFEGIGLVLPIQDAMDLKVRHRLPAALCWSMAGITFFFISFGAAGYLAYGRDVANFVTMDLPESSLAGTTVRVMYSLGLVLTSPLQLFPAVKVLERILWPAPSSGPKKTVRDLKKKWLKNLLRSAVVAVTVLVALVAGSRFDSFTGIVGGVCAVPLALVYPPLFHMSLFGELDTPRERVLHRFLLVGGVLSGVASTVVAVMAL